MKYILIVIKGAIFCIQRNEVKGLEVPHSLGKILENGKKYKIALSITFGVMICVHRQSDEKSEFQRSVAPKSIFYLK